jgi:hypothetical protein
VDRFRQIIACSKGLELRNPDTLQVITSCKALHVMSYKNQNIAGKNASYLLEYCMKLSSSIYAERCMGRPWVTHGYPLGSFQISLLKPNAQRKEAYRLKACFFLH